MKDEAKRQPNGGKEVDTETPSFYSEMGRRHRQSLWDYRKIVMDGTVQREGWWRRAVCDLK